MQLLHLMLCKEADAQLAGGGDLAAHRFQALRQQLRQSRFALAILAEQGDAVVLVDAQVQALEHHLAIIADRYAVGGDDGGGKLVRLREGELGPRLVFRRADRLHLLQHLDARLRLFRLAGLCLEAVDEALQVRPAQILLLRRCRLHRPLRRPLPGELIVGAGIVGERAVLQMQDRADGAVEQPPVVADDDHRMRIPHQVILQPERAFQVQIVGRLVEQQVVGRGEQHRRQRHPHAPPAGERRARQLLCLVAEAHAVQDGCGARFRRPGVDILQPGLDFGDAVRVLGGIRFLQQRRPFHVRRQHRVEQGDLVRRYLLRDAADAGVGRQRDLAAVGLQLAADQAEQSGFAGAVAADQTDLVSGRNEGGGGFEQRPAFDRKAEIGYA